MFQEGATDWVKHHGQRGGTIHDKEDALRRRLGCGYKDAEPLQATGISSEARPLAGAFASSRHHGDRHAANCGWKYYRPSFLQPFASEAIETHRYDNFRRSDNRPPSQGITNAIRKTADFPDIIKRIQSERQVANTRVYKAVDGDQDARTNAYAH
ncbi:hypothetical protein BDZ85DRAFT_245835 [Elsinoe ampelina]|uniref:Uncharacterized protein n=1 Tax=Elsinoe ampelina TaxID=302913 RepID=A0A6A6GNC2_9PEZI|nr:hypothetical protein BDZ85DRAFT_245835 [Elsinoe ampelina]